MKKRQVRPKKNLELRAYLASQDITLTEIANEMYVSLPTLSAWFSATLSEETKAEVMQAAEKIIKGREVMKGVYGNEKGNKWSNMDDSLGGALGSVVNQTVNAE